MSEFLIKNLVDLKNTINTKSTKRVNATYEDENGTKQFIYNEEGLPIVEKVEVEKSLVRINDEYKKMLEMEMGRASAYLKNTKWVIDNINEFGKDKLTYHPEIKEKRVLVYNYIQDIQDKLKEVEGE